ncbi:uracil-DNA glycosylase family protein [Jannaschia sp. LMIT008]|uniref:uracil-DNA glycosylase family protein n=1 Tax=Jannaschia maritima TaxID=3032585 RepID=UPI0028111C85|nr:uracil-DNA glycosylase family protein [Jannaschia sp. LMIT008]
MPGTLLNDPAVAAARLAHLNDPHMRPLAAYCAGLRATGGTVPDMDPLDGGTAARLLLLLEKPGPAAARAGIVSFDNDSPTGAAARRFRDRAGIRRDRVVVWNVVPWWNGTIRFTAAERRAGLTVLPAFLALFSDLRGAVTVGRQAATARDMLTRHGLDVHACAHPSPQVRAAFPDRWAAIPDVWARAAAAAGADR